jgi:hypothetical protein
MRSRKMKENQLSSNMSIQEDVVKLRIENEKLKQELKLYKKALDLFVNWADECDFGYDNLGDLKYEYEKDTEKMGYIEGLIYIAVSEAKKELAE